ncbi:putative lipase [Gymnopus androsaceus JB14]|uniref:Lipase n=1 Tax=Gymnopus androsaceus JB14 TaxID=1447944 RepID=A0A6A4GLG2_9AGAR|nr:putative lipase [Gymnopus androsaceus JB14]
MNSPDRIPKQPLHPSIIPKLDPEYVQFHEKYIQYETPAYMIPWDPIKMRAVQAFDVGSREPLDVGKIEEFEIPMKLGDGRKTPVRAYTPPGAPPVAGWPFLLYFHGGGWIVGGLDTENSIITYLCVDYRLAPENKFPAAVEDAVEALQWVIINGKARLNVDTSKIATGGISAGGNLAAVLALKSAQTSFNPPLPKPMLLQLLLAPAVDQTATDAPGGRWERNKHAPILPSALIKLFKEMYLRNEDDKLNWEASPLLAPEEVLRRAPKAWIGVGEMDVLCNEAEAYAEKLNKCGVETDCVVYGGGTHAVFLLDSTIMKNSANAVSDAVNALAKAFGTAGSS